MNWHELDWAVASEPHKLLALHNVTCSSTPPGSDYPAAILSCRPGERKLRLFALACWLTHPDVVADPDACQLLNAVPLWSDGTLTREQLLAMPVGADPTYYTLFQHAAETAVGNALVNCGRRNSRRRRAAAAAWRDLVPSPWMPRQDGTEACPVCDGDGRVHGCGLTNYTRNCYDCNFDGRGRDGQGRHRGRQPAAWLTPTVRALAAAAYCQRRPDGSLDPDALGVLGDAAEEAGCTHADLLAHLRGRRRCPGCWPLADGGGFDRAVPEPPLRHRARRCGHCPGDGWLGVEEPHWPGCWAVDALHHDALSLGLPRQKLPTWSALVPLGERPRPAGKTARQGTGGAP